MGPCATQMLADYGADVIKIERPGTGDLSRTSFRRRSGRTQQPGVLHRSTATSARSCSNLRREAARPSSSSWSTTADVVVNNFRAGVMERMGFGYEELSQTSIRASSMPSAPASASTGPYRTRAARTCWRRRCPASWRASPTPSLPLSIYADHARRLFGRHASRAGHPAGAAAAREDRQRPAHQRVALRFDAGHADAGGRATWMRASAS